MARYRRILFLVCALFTVAITDAWASDWQPVTGAVNLRDFMSGLQAERNLASGAASRGEYHPDGTGTLFAWGAAIPRTWEVKGEDLICVTAQTATQCYRIEESQKDPSRYRAREIHSGKMAEFTVTDRKAVVTAEAAKPDNQGGPATASADELAAELSNPNTAVATLNLKNQFRWFEGDLPDADNQSSYTLLFQPVLPFVLGSGDKIIWRPAIPLLVDQPIPDPVTGGFSSESSLGDIAFDLAYAPKTDRGLLFAYGLIITLPTATNDLGTDRWTLGPEMLIGKASSEHVYGLFPNHQWDVAGSGDADINLTSIQAFYTYLPGGGWNVGSGPTITYDWEAEQWTVPLQINAGKTMVFNGRPWKFSVELNYYVEKTDAFGPEWLLSFNFAPVVKNGLAGWFGLDSR